MATRKWLGQSPAVAQVDTLTVSAVATNGRQYIATMAGKTVSYTAVVPGDTNDSIAEALYDLLSVTSIADFQEATYTLDANVITCVSSLPGRPFTLTASNSGGTTGTLTRAAVTANTGPNVWTAVLNWSGSTLPVDGDTVILENSSVDILYELDQSAVDLAAMVIYASYTGRIGLTPVTDAGVAEYRETNLKISPGVFDVGLGEGSGSQRIRINAGTVAFQLTCHKTASSESDGAYALQIKGTHASNTVTVLRGSVGIAAEAGDVATVATLTVSYKENVDGDADVYCGSGTTLTTITKTGGDLHFASNVTTFLNAAGDATVNGAATITTLTAAGGVVYHCSTGTVTNVIVASGGSVDGTRDTRAKTFTNVQVYANSTLNFPHGNLTTTNGVDMVQCSLPQLTALDLGRNITISTSAI